MKCPNCGSDLEQGHAEMHAGSACVTIDVYYIICSDEYCGFYQIGTTPNKACSGLAPADASEDDVESGASH